MAWLADTLAAGNSNYNINELVTGKGHCGLDAENCGVGPQKPLEIVKMLEQRRLGRAQVSMSGDGSGALCTWEGGGTRLVGVKWERGAYWGNAGRG